MKLRGRTGIAGLWAAGLVLSALAAAAQDDLYDQVDQALSFSGLNDAFRLRISGTFDLEGYYQSQTQSGLIFSEQNYLLNPRLSLFVDAQMGRHLYGFVQARADNGFDPDEPGKRVRLDEYVLRLTPFDDARLNLEVLAAFLNQ